MRFHLLCLFSGCVLISCSSGPGDQLEQNLSLVTLLEPLDVTLGKPQPGEWLYVHKEAGQAYDVYKSNNPVSPHGQQKYIYLQPIGHLTPVQNDVIQYTAEYLEIFFGLKTIVAPALSDSIIPAHARRPGLDITIDNESVPGYGEQLKTSYILYDILLKNIPPDAIVVMAVTAKDLYPSDDWNFVFGQASTKKRVGVSSISRFTDAALDSTTYPLCLERLIKTSSHEISHMFSCQHCTHAVCVMNGSNSLYESDMRPNRLCSECHKKLCWNLKFDVHQRLTALEQFFLRHKLSRDYSIISKELAAVKLKAG
jgi:archaemetzincin